MPNMYSSGKNAGQCRLINNPTSDTAGMNDEITDYAIVADWKNKICMLTSSKLENISNSASRVHAP